MNKNIEKYKKDIDKIEVDSNLKQKTIEKIISKEKKDKKKIFTFKVITEFAAVFIIVTAIGYFAVNNKEIINNSGNNDIKIADNSVERIDYSVAGIERINNMEELEKIFKNNRTNYYENMEQGIITNDFTTKSDTTTSSEKNDFSSKDYSDTNVQVDNVDEADIVKTDGKYIYYLKRDSKTIEIVDVDMRKVVSKVKFADDRNINNVEMFLHDSKLVVIEDDMKDSTTRKNGSLYETSAVIYNISDKENINKEREVSTTGEYVDSRMIGNNLYFISNEYAYYNDEIPLPQYKDTIKNKEYEKVECNDIYYLKGSEDSSYTLVTAFNINSDEKAKTKTFLGIGNTIYSSEENMYVTKTKVNRKYNRKSLFSYNYNYSTDIFKFKLMNNDIELVAKGEVKGGINNQFSMDEYNGYFRIATTDYNNKQKETNNILILDDKLNKVGGITGVEPGEKIYSVRFMKDVGYVVTFKQIDPLLVIDLKDPKNPKIKGKLKIPGYSSYLHPYDENHIIGIGKNTKDNGYGGAISTGIKISMFDISDLNNPKEVFKTSIGKEYADSYALNNHKAVLCSKEKEILAIPVYTNNSTQEFSGAIVYKIDLANNKFEEVSRIKSYKNNNFYNTYYDIERLLYIGDYLYAISSEGIKILNISTFEMAEEIKFN